MDLFRSRVSRVPIWQSRAWLTATGSVKNRKEARIFNILLPVPRPACIVTENYVHICTFVHIFSYLHTHFHICLYIYKSQHTQNINADQYIFAHTQLRTITCRQIFAYSVIHSHTQIEIQLQSPTFTFTSFTTIQAPQLQLLRNQCSKCTGFDMDKMV